jgi:hypothetical protein
MGVFQSGTDASDLQGADGSDTAVTGRWTTVLRYEDGGERVLHVGVALSERWPNRGVVVINQEVDPNEPTAGARSASVFAARVGVFW